MFYANFFFLKGKLMESDEREMKILPWVDGILGYRALKVR